MTGHARPSRAAVLEEARQKDLAEVRRLMEQKRRIDDRISARLHRIARMNARLS